MKLIGLAALLFLSACNCDSSLVRREEVQQALAQRDIAIKQLSLVVQELGRRQGAFGPSGSTGKLPPKPEN